MMGPVLYVVIFAWSVWCIASQNVKDGIIGRILYSAIAIAAFAAVFSHNETTIAASNQLIAFCTAFIGGRHFVLKMISAWRVRHGHR